jgi:D-glycero-D-manno-heptose 1,7-bisphosphate phosphatase
LTETLRRAIFLDRDGVINEKLPEDHYVARPSELRLLPGAVEALQMLYRLGYALIVVTNQRGIARGFMTEEDLSRVHDFLRNILKDKGVFLDGIYHCPHETFENCPCRKPQPGMILEAVEHFGIDPAGSYMVGDSPSDVEAGRSAGVMTVRISRDSDEEADMVFADLLEFARYMESAQKARNGDKEL